MNARHEERRIDWRPTPWRQLTQTNDGLPQFGRRARRRRNQYTPIIERGWFLALVGIAALGLLVASSQGWLP